jgi:hypothetical protein
VGPRRTIVVHTRLAGHLARVEAARAGEQGVQIGPMGIDRSATVLGVLRLVAKGPQLRRKPARSSCPVLRSPYGGVPSRMVRRRRSRWRSRQCEATLFNIAHFF